MCLVSLFYKISFSYFLPLKDSPAKAIKDFVQLSASQSAPHQVIRAYDLLITFDYNKTHQLMPDSFYFS